MIDVRVQAADFDPGRQLGRLAERKPLAIASFTGLAVAAEEVTEIWIDHYPALAKAALARIAEETRERFDAAGILLIHRHGRLAPGDRLLFAAAAAAQVEPAQQACARLVQALRTEAPFWRKELQADGTGRWIEPS